MQTAALVISVFLVYGIVFVGVNVLSGAFVALGGLLHRTAGQQDGLDKNMWLFSLLMGLTKTPTVILGTAAYALWAIGYVTANPLYNVAESAALFGFLTFLAIRLLCLLLGGWLFGNSIRSVIKSLDA